MSTDDAAGDLPAPAQRRRELLDHRLGAPLVVANEFSEVHVSLVQTRNGTRLLIDSPKSGQWTTLDPLELESLTWQSRATFSRMVGNPMASLFTDEEQQ
jgi:hypothetical protein